MASAAQISANRLNAQRSTGPRTESGKQRSRFNALRHGVTSQLVVLPTDDLQAYNAFTQAWHTDFAPEGVLETQLVQTLADTQWRLNRIRAQETNLYALPHLQPDSQSLTSDNPQLEAALAEAEIVRTQTAALNSLSTREQRLHKIFAATLAQLKERQSARKAAAASQMEAAVILANHHEEQDIPFNPKDFGFVLTNRDIELCQWRSHVMNQAHRAYVDRQNPPA